ncbi:hypothetical protein R3I93_016935 [Phoxinus phoxinus]|uniref:Ig-like domain-containing protein n=1 Tax=Phoxinus phoxinus TaxID=58324 RepID=A0AAN9CGS0_9TELE
MCGVFGVGADEEKRVSVMEGDPVTLNPDPTKIQGFILILWRFGESGSVIAETDGTKISYPHLTERFRDRLKLDHQTGSLTINNMRNKQSGFYQLEINHSAGNTYMRFSVTVYESPPVIDIEMKSVTEGDSVTLQTDVTEPHGDELIVWRVGDEGKLIAKRDIEAKSSKLYEDTNERFRDRLQLDHQTGSLTITNSRTTDSELYTVKISSSKQTSYKRFNVNVTEPVVSPVLSSGAVAGIVVVLLLVFAVAAFGVFYYRHKISKYERQMAVTEEKSVSLMEGDDVTLKTGAEVQRDDQIMWMFRPQETLIAERQENRETYDGGLRFRDRLKLDKTTGSLTIRNTRTTDTGEYKLQIKSNSGVSYKILSVVVRGNGVNESEIPLLNQRIWTE